VDEGVLAWLDDGSMNDELAKEIRQSVAEFYETYGPAFARTRGFTWPEEKMIADQIHPGMTVVDVGAGNGRFAKTIPHNVTYFGFEPSSSLRSSADPKLDIRPGGFPRVPIDDKTADITVCFAVLHHLPTTDDQRLAINELIRVTKPGGFIAATAWHLDQPGDNWVPWKAEGADAKRFVYAFSLEEWGHLWTRPDLSIEQITEEKNLFVLARKK
jgi:ubiquinone/menaquinone biosynthesis C-methylase UbiE